MHWEGWIYESDGTIIDSGLALFFPNPASFTGEDTVDKRLVLVGTNNLFSDIPLLDNR
jgi:tRNA U34 5-carboxymethylaminomethyl modifying GTPase MnmE/TrmE